MGDMAKTITATEAVRRFSEILNSIKYRGEEFTIVRSGKPIALMSPVSALHKERVLGELKEILKKLPSLENEAERFEEDLRDIRRDQPSLPDRGEWE